MIGAKIIDVLSICLPVFGVVVLGKGLALSGRFHASHRHFVNALVYWISLPALIFSAVVQQPFSQFMQPGFVAISLIPILFGLLLFSGLARLLRVQGGLAAAFVFGSFWANVAYAGFPLCRSAFGQAGVEMAAVYNALAMPIYVILGYGLILRHAGGPGRESSPLGQAFRNPIVGAALAGLLFSFLLSPFRDGALSIPLWLTASGQILMSFLDLVGQMGLPLALLAIGASLELKAIQENRLLLGLTLTGKLLLSPFIAWIVWKLVFTDLPAPVGGTAVLLSAMPNAVAAYVIATQLKVEEGFVSAMLVFGTMASVITIPLWVYLILP